MGIYLGALYTTASCLFPFCIPSTVALGCCSTRMPKVVCNSGGGKHAGAGFLLLQGMDFCTCAGSLHYRDVKGTNHGDPPLCPDCVSSPRTDLMIGKKFLRL